MPDTTLIESLRQVLERGPTLRLALLFGSAARDTARADSDLDIAILPRDPDLPLADELQLQAQLSRVAQREVDLVRLDLCTPLVRWRVAREGIALLAEPAVEVPRFRARAGSEHAELEPQLRRAGERFRRRVLQGGSTLDRGTRS